MPHPAPSPVLELMARHRTVRRYASAPLPDADLERAVRAAQMASTSSHVQAYAVLQVTRPEERARLAELCGNQPQVEEAGAFLVVCADQRRHRLVAAAEERAYEPNLESFLVGVIDAALFAQNLALALESQGYGICFIGGLRNGIAAADTLLELPADVLPLFGLCAGVPAEEPSPRPRLPVAGVLFRDRYPDDDTLRATIAEHDAEMARYYADRGSPGRDWSGGVARKWEQPRRPHLFGYYASKGVSWR